MCGIGWWPWMTEGAIFYELQNGDGQPAIRNGYIGFE